MRRPSGHRDQSRSDARPIAQWSAI